MNPKLFILIAFFTIIVCIVASIDQSETDTANQEFLDALVGPREKRGWFCWDKMVKGCCNNRCKGDGCVWLMCGACC